MMERGWVGWSVGGSNQSNLRTRSTPTVRGWVGIRQERGEGVEKGGQANQMNSQTPKQLTRGDRGDVETQYQTSLRADSRGVS